MRTYLFLLFFLLAFFSSKAQYSFSGHINKKEWHDNVYLSIVEDYRKISGVYSEQIIAKVKTDSLGYFKFSGNQLDLDNRIYRIHVDNCFEEEQDQNHFNGHCDDSKEVIFIAKNTDSIVFPFSFEKQMFCDIRSSNEKTAVFVKIDSLMEDMRFAFAEYRSEANRKLNNKKWFKTFQDFGKNLDEPIAELYIYSFLSDRGNELHEYYLEDLKTNNYYEELLGRLDGKYPNSQFTKQYKNELTSDKFIVKEVGTKKPFNWLYLLLPIMIISLLLNGFLIWTNKNEKAKNIQINKEQLTNQEEKVLELLLTNLSNKDIAKSLFVSVSTVKSHINNIYKKCNVQSRDEIKSLFNN